MYTVETVLCDQTKGRKIKQAINMSQHKVEEREELEEGSGNPMRLIIGSRNCHRELLDRLPGNCMQVSFLFQLGE